MTTVSPIIEDIFLYVDEKLCREQRIFPSIPQDIRFALALQAMAGVGIVRKAISHSKGFADWRTTPLFEEMRLFGYQVRFCVRHCTCVQAIRLGAD
jgi:hypothetical protein